MKSPRATEAKSASAKVLKRAPRPSLLRVISRKGKHPGRAHRIKRWHRYQVGMSLVHCRETAGLDHLDVLYYERHGLMTLRPMTAEECRKVLRRWDGHLPTRADAAADSLETAEPAPRVSHEVNATAHISAREDEHDNADLAAVDHAGSEAVLRLPHLPARSDATGRMPRGSPPVNSMGRILGPQAERDRAYLDAVARGAWETAHRISHCGFPPDATVEELSVWGARRYRTRVATNQPDPRTYEGWDVSPMSGTKDSKTHEEWRAYYDRERRRYPRYDARKEWEVFKQAFRFLVVYPLSILGALGLFSGQKE